MKQFGGGAGGAGGMPDFGDDDDEGDEEAGEKVGLPSISHTKPEIATDRRPLHFAIPDARARGGLRVQVKDAHDIGKLKKEKSTPGNFTLIHKLDPLCTPFSRATCSRHS